MTTTEIKGITGQLEKWIGKIGPTVVEEIVWALAMDEELWQIFRAEVLQTRRELHDERSINIPTEGETKIETECLIPFPSWAKRRPPSWTYMGWIKCPPAAGLSFQQLCCNAIKDGQEVDIYCEGATCWTLEEQSK